MALVDLLVAMMRDHITAEEVAMLIRLFLEKAPPTDVILKGIQHIVQANMDMEVLHFLSFPLLPSTYCPGPRHSLGCREGDGENRPAHQLTSPWYVAPIHLPLVGQNCWPHAAEGFSLSLWMRVPPTAQENSAHLDRKSRRSTEFRDSNQDSTEQEKCPSVGRRGPPRSGDSLVEEGFLHIASLGSKALMLQLWAHLATGTFLFRICVDPNDEMKAGLLAQAESGEGLLIPGRWQHVALTYTQQPEGKKSIRGTLALWLCGLRKCELSLDYTLPRKSSLSTDTKTFCLLGHYLTCADELARQRGCWDMGCALLFNSSRVGPEEAFYLYASGPDCTSVIPCKYGTPSPNLSRYMTQEGLQDWDTLCRSRGGGPEIASLIESLAVVYVPGCPSQFSIYEPLTGLKGQPKTAVTQRTFSSKMAQSNVLEPQVLRALRPNQSQGLQSVLHKIGGAGTFIFLFARAVELSDCEQTQALALHILLSLVKQNQHRVQEMDSCHGYSMIHQVLINTKCIVGYHMLKAVLDGCCSQEILTVSADGQFCLNTESTAVVQDLRLVSGVLLDWKIWSRAQDGVWETLLAALEILIRVHHPQQTFNIQQLLKAQVVNRFLLTCQVLQEQLTPVPQEVCLSFAKIIQEVLGSPPDLELLRLIYNFLLAVHPPTKTHVCHTPTSFYFYLHIDGNLHQEKVQSIVSLRQYSSGEKSASSSVVSSSPISFTVVPPQDPTPSPSPEQDGGGQFLLPPSETLTAPSSPSLSHGDGDGGPCGAHQSSTETVRRDETEQLLSSCDSASTVRDLRADTPPVSVEEEPEEGRAADRFDSASEEATCGPESLKRLQSPQRRESSFASLGLAFPAHNGALPNTRRSSLVFSTHNGTLPITRRSSLVFPTHNSALPITRRSSLADSGMLPMNWESYAYTHGYNTSHSKADSTDRSGSLCRSGVEDCLVLMCCGLYELLRGKLLLLPDRMLDQVMDKLIQPQALIVLINHPSPLIQLGVMKLLDAYFIRASKEQKEKFLKSQGFSLLANQLYQQQGSQELLEFSLEMLFGSPRGAGG
ncbi:hypothetical protein SKAU_G00164820 [Synaphobranchus kaupii]|uniref:Lysosomal trafficking regulator n=1 Tax=Synaphobranchus kaupii TaxID=118154 RepID=A0A9Q1J088_SYNKA|nr:hypothetical protein SKAU_G00164820 [Synaphobranchus kaupii]